MTQSVDRRYLRELSECDCPIFGSQSKLTYSYIREARMQRHGLSRSAPAKDSEIENQRKAIICTSGRLLAAQVDLTNGIPYPAQKRKKLLKLIDPLDCSGNHRKTSSLRQSDTCLWLSATDAYKSWREGKGSFLWLQGKGIITIVQRLFVADTTLVQLVRENRF